VEKLFRIFISLRWNFTGGSRRIPENKWRSGETDKDRRWVRRRMKEGQIRRVERKSLKVVPDGRGIISH
jgi:hypothetical protein